MPSDDEGEPGAPDINAQIAALATGLAGLQTAVTQLVTAVNDNVTETNRRVQFASDEAQARADAAGAGAAPPQPGRNPLVEAIEKLAHPTPKEVHGQTIREYWPFAMEHKVQSYNLQPSAMVERDTGSITTPLAAFDRRTSDCDHYNLHPFGSDLFVVTQPNLDDRASTTCSGGSTRSGHYSR